MTSSILSPGVLYAWLIQRKKQRDSLATKPPTPPVSVSTTSASGETVAAVSPDADSSSQSMTPAAARHRTQRHSPTFASKRHRSSGDE